MSTTQQKGSALEGAVLTIESAILRASPAYSDKAFKIKARHIATVDDVRHEVDIWVKVDLGPGYSSVFLFECKNWSNKVEKNEVIIFSEKVRVLGAQRGFFVAREYTKDARAQAALDTRVELMDVEEEQFTDLHVPLAYHVLASFGSPLRS